MQHQREMEKPKDNSNYHRAEAESKQNKKKYANMDYMSTATVFSNVDRRTEHIRIAYKWNNQNRQKQTNKRKH